MASNGVYGTRVPVGVTPDDIEIYYSYSPTRTSDDINNKKFTKLPSSLLADVKSEDNSVIEGLKNLRLPLQYFNQKGFYNVYIKPSEYEAVISNVSTLTEFPDVRGIVLNNDNNDDRLNNLLSENNSLVGYRVIYLMGNGTRENYYRLITSNNKCEPVEQNISSVNQNSVRYRFSESGSLTFLTLTPSVAPTFKPNATPFIGLTAQKIIITNTKFEPILLDIEMTEKDIDTVSTMLEGNQLRNLDKGLITTFNNKNEIYHQSENYTLKDSSTGKPIYEVKKNKKESIDFTQTINDK